MKKLRVITVVALALALMLCACGAQAKTSTDYSSVYSNLIGAMEIVNCQSWASLRVYPDSSSARLAKVPLGATVVNCYYQDDKFTYCEYNGISGYILNSNLSFIYGPVGYEYPAENYLGNMQIVNCVSFASLRDYPSTSANLLMRVPLGEIVTNVFYRELLLGLAAGAAGHRRLPAGKGARRRHGDRLLLRERSLRLLHLARLRGLHTGGQPGLVIRLLTGTGLPAREALFL